MSSRHSLSYAETLAQLYPRTNGGIKLGLENTQKLLDAVGNPEEGIPFVVVAGTNGKGSTSSLLAHALNTAGCKTGLYTSPHLLRFTERIRIGGNEISQESVIKHYETVHQAEGACDYPPTFFECVTAMTLLEFQAQQVDIGVLEVGLGGRLDSTNVVEKLLSIITPIGLDHQQFLGDTLSQIATEKAGIIPPKGNVVSADQIQEAEDTLSQIIEERGASRYPLAPLMDQSTLPAFQKTNIRVAQSGIQVLAKLGFPTGPSHFAQALATWKWPGRYDAISSSPPVLLDGAHNPHALEALFEAIAQDQRFQGKPIHTVFSAITTKQSAEMVPLVKKYSSTLLVCPTSVSRSLSLSELGDLLGSQESVRESPQLALDEAKRNASNSNGIVLITGSLFLVADVLHLEDRQERDPPIAS